MAGHYQNRIRFKYTGILKLVCMQDVSKNVKKLFPVINFAKRNEIDHYLNEFNIDLESKEYKCYICGEIVTRENIGMVFPSYKPIRIVCNKPECIEKISIYKYLP